MHERDQVRGRVSQLTYAKHIGDVIVVVEDMERWQSPGWRGALAESVKEADVGVDDLFCIELPDYYECRESDRIERGMTFRHAVEQTGGGERKHFFGDVSSVGRKSR